LTKVSQEIINYCHPQNYIMTRNATFEFTTNLQPKIVSMQLSKLWFGLGYEVDIYTLDSSICMLNDTIKLCCTLDYFMGASEEEVMMRQVVDYLLKISIEHKIYYYRYYEADSRWDLEQEEKLSTKIAIDDLFTEEYAGLFHSKERFK
jgi:hypothetical protein